MISRISIARPLIGEEEIHGVTEVISSGMLTQGKFVEDFEREFALYMGVEFAVATNSGTSALHTALASLGIGRDDEVITTDFSFVSSASSIIMQGARPVFCDIDPQTYNISADLLEEKITENTKAILPVHLYGQPCDMERIMEIAGDHSLLVVEDACQAHGAEYWGKKVGSFGDVGVFSFYPTKNITTGEGGMLTTNDIRIAKRARMIRSHGQSKRYHHDFLGYNYRMTDIAAAIGLTQLEKLDVFNKKRKKNADFLTKRIRDMRGITPPYVSPHVEHVFHQYTIRVEDGFPISRDGFASHLEGKGVEYGMYYPLPIHKQSLFKKLGYTNKKVNCPVSCEISKKVLSLPVHPGLTMDDLEYIVENIKLVEEQQIWMSA